jgi:epoxyqueuosine reductase
MLTSADKKLSVLVKQKAHDLGFDLCGIAPSGNLSSHKPIIEEWCASGMNGDMSYLGRDVDKRINPELLYPGTKSVIVTGMNYFSNKKQGLPVISRYAYGADYHDVIINKLNTIIDFIGEISPGAKGKAFVDNAPLTEKAWGREAGLGWPGRHSVLINKDIGSFFFLGVILLTVELDFDEPYDNDHCGDCRKCIDSCPTGAINENRTIDARKCISYLTVESKMPVPEAIVHKMEGRVFGCDKCQEVCPWNQHARPHNKTEFELREEIKQMSLDDWLSLTEEQFNRFFRGTAVARRKYEIFM